MDLTCPKCQGTMRTYERNGVHVDQCGECRGIFLDRGELERLVDAESAWHGGGSSAPRPAPHASSAGGLGAVVEQVVRAKTGSSSLGSHYGGKRKKSLFDELFG